MKKVKWRTLEENGTSNKKQKKTTGENFTFAAAHDSDVAWNKLKRLPNITKSAIKQWCKLLNYG